MSPNLSTRLDSLERIYQRGTCVTCFDYPVRIIATDEDTDVLISETMSETGCPDCGRRIASTIEIVDVDVLECEVGHDATT